MCTSGVGEETFVSRHCDLTVQVSHYLGCSVFMSVVHNNLTLWRAPAHVLPCGHIAAANFSLWRFIICAESALVYFLVTAMPHGRLLFTDCVVACVFADKPNLDFCVC